MMSANPPQLETPVAYLSAEFGFDAKIPIYAGGLGVLSGDTIKQAADENFPFVGVGLLYRGHYQKQTLTPDGEQNEEIWQYDPVGVGFEHVYREPNQPLFISVQIGDESIWLRCWKKTFSDQVILYLLDSETDQNPIHLRSITQMLYVGDTEYQLKQEIVHGVGAVKLLTELGIVPRLYHLNEGRPVFAHWQLILDVMKHHAVTAEAALRLVRNKVVYTNHTLVAAGNMLYPAEVLKPLAKPYADAMGIGIDQLLSLGSGSQPDAYSMTTAALNVSRLASGVSEVHTKLSKQLWPDYAWTNITNGVHRTTWQAEAFRSQIDDPAELWHKHLEHKEQLKNYVHATTGFSYDQNRLVISWARRIAGYKQLNSLFADLERLHSLCSNTGREIQILISGKAHFGDAHGKELLREVIHFFSTKLSGYALFIPNYNIEVAQFLTRGSDVWLNTPVKGKEASGTSGMKAIANGVVQLTVQDGWTDEVDWSQTGFTLDPENLSDSIYNQLQRIQELYYQRNESGIPFEWLEYMKASIALYNRFSTERMFSEYKQQLYNYD